MLAAGAGRVPRRLGTIFNDRFSPSIEGAVWLDGSTSGQRMVPANYLPHRDRERQFFLGEIVSGAGINTITTVDAFLPDGRFPYAKVDGGSRFPRAASSPARRSADSRGSSMSRPSISLSTKLLRSSPIQPASVKRRPMCSKQ